jgi:nucleotide-binding universal stress UspA family protein
MTGTAVVWVAEGTWPACVDAARTWVPESDDVVLLHVAGGEMAAAHGALAGLLGRGRRGSGADLDALSASAVGALLDRATKRLGRPARTELRTGRVEREVVAAAEGASVLICARDGDRSRLGPRSLGPATRFVVDHVPCPVLLVWPGEAPGVDSIPPPPPPGEKPAPPPGPPPHSRS